MKKVLGYTNVWSVTPGETISVMVSTYGPERYRADLVRVICGDDDPDHQIYRDEEIEAPFAGEYPGRGQPIDAGSYALVPNSPSLEVLESFTVQAWVWPTTPGRGEQALITRWRDDPGAGFALLIDDTGALAMRVGNGNGDTAEINTGEPLAARRWYLVSGSYDAVTKRAQRLPGTDGVTARDAQSGQHDQQGCARRHSHCRFVLDVCRIPGAPVDRETRIRTSFQWQDGPAAPGRVCTFIG